MHEDTTLLASGRAGVHGDLVRYASNRLLIHDTLVRHPEIHDVEIVAPLIVAGLPRSGTTHLLNLHGSRQPIPIPALLGVVRAGPDAR